MKRGKKTKKLIPYFIPLILCFVLANIGVAEEELPIPKEPQMSLSEFQMPGRLEAEGTHFELKDSSYLNITLDSSQPIKLVLESVPEMVSLHIESTSGATTTQLTLSGFHPSITYYKYEDNYHNVVTFTTDNAGRYTYTQDLSKPHLVFIQPHASTIFLTDTGFSDPTVGTWDPDTRTAILTKDLNETIQIDADNITLDGNGHTISSGETGSGVYLYRRTEVTIKNLNISGFVDGVLLYQSSNNNLLNNVTADNRTGISLMYSSNNNLSNNTVSGRSSLSSGISLYASSENNLYANLVSDNWLGIYISVSGNSNLSSNIMTANRYHFGLVGLSDPDFNNNIDTSNTVDGKPIYYIKNATDQVYGASTNAGTIYCINCNNVTIKDLNLSKNGYGIFFWKTHNSVIENVVFEDNSTGICLNSSYHNKLFYNTVLKTSGSGILLRLSDNNNLLRNSVDNSWRGIYLESSSDNNLLGNITSNSTVGIFLDSSHGNILAGNTLSANDWYGLWLFSYPNNNKIYNNNFILNRIQAVGDETDNVFNLDKPIGGNYWSDWTGPDDNSDGFVDNPYVFTGGQDTLPWAEQDGWLIGSWFDTTAAFTIFDLSETSFNQSTSTKTLLSQKATLSNLTLTGDLSGSLDFTEFEIVRIKTGSFAGKGFSKGEFEANLEGLSYKGRWQGMVYLVTSENKLYLKGGISGDINGICEGYLSESIPGSGTYDKYQATWRINRLGTEVISATINLEATLSYQPSSTFTSEIYFYQTNMEGSCIGYYTGPLTAVVTHLRLVSENECQGEGFSIISYTSHFGSGEGWAYNQLTSTDRIEFQGLSKGPLLGPFSGYLDESKSPKTFSGIIERLDLGLPPAPDLKVRVWGPQRVSPGQTIDYIIEYRNDGLKVAEETLLFVALDYNLKYLSASEKAFYNDILHTVDWNLGSLPAKSSGYLSLQDEVVWGLLEGTTLETDAIVNELLPHSDKKGIFVNGIGLRVGEVLNGNYLKKCNDFASDRDLDWVPAYDTGSGSGDVKEVINALNGVATKHNGLLDPKVTGGFEYDTVWGYSGGTRTLVTAIVQGKLKTKELVLISPVCIAPFELEALHSLGVEKIIIYQSEKDRLRVGGLYQLKIPKDDPLRNQPWLEVRDRDYVHSFWLQKLNNEANKNKENMSSTAPHTITTARDPNEKHVSPEGDVSPGQRLTYKVEYENEGEGIAYGVYFTDTLDEDLDDRILEIGPVIDVETGVQIAEPGSYDSKTRTISWFVGEVGSGQGGYTNFSINVRNDAPNNAEVINFATVYFPSVPEATRTNGTVNRVITVMDNIPPTTTASISPTPNPAGWNNTDVTINLSATDNEGGSGVKEIRYKLTGAVSEERTISADTTQIIISTEGTTTLTYWSVDNAGNVESAKSLTVKLDKTPPAITTQLSPQPNSYGWNNTDVTVSLAATDALSGVVSVSESVTVSTEGKDQYIGGEAIDFADNKATTYVTLNIDKTPPTISITATPNILWPPNHKLVDVTVGGEATDSLSGIASTNFKVTDEYGQVEPAISDFNTTIQLEAWRNGNDLDGRVYTISVTAKDKADNEASDSTTVICPHDQRKK